MRTLISAQIAHIFCILLCFLLLVVGMPLCPAAADADQSKIVVISGIDNEQTHAIAKEVLREAYRRLGYQVNFVLLPGQRSLVMANDGESDGDIARIAGTEKEFPNLVMVPTPVIHFQGVAFTKSVSKKIQSWDDLKGLKVGIIRGIRYSLIGTQGLNPFFAEDMTHLFTLVDQGRIDLAIAVLDAGQIEIRKNFQNSGIHRVGSVLCSEPLYDFVHVKNQHLVNDLDRALQEMTAAGEIEKIHRNTREKLLSD